MATIQTAPGTPAAGAESQHGVQRLGFFLCWAVVFADIGTSVYYVPGILYNQPGVGRLAGIFVLLTLIVFILLTLKYAEVSVRFPEGGGVVTVAARGLNPWAGAVGGMFILVDYFLTAAISSLSGLQYFATLVPRIGSNFTLIVLDLLVLVALGVLNWWGIKESAVVSAVIAVAALLSDVVILVIILVRVPPQTIGLVFQEIFHGHAVTPVTLITGYAGAFLAFSGLESISQLSPVMALPRRRTVTIALALVAITVGITSPLLTIFSTTLIHVTSQNSATVITELGGRYGGGALKLATSVAASALLIFASNTAIIGAYHVFLALSRMRFFPAIVERKNKWRGTPHVSIILATGIPMLVLVAVRGDINTLGDMYAFGLLGAFSLTCIGLDVLRRRERKHGEPIDFHDEHDHEEQAVAVAGPSRLQQWRTTAQTSAGTYLGQTRVAQLQRVQAGAATRRAGVARRMQPAAVAVSGRWPDIKYYLGYLTTFLVTVAWVTNLISKPLATGFGGGLTVLGVGIAVIHFRHQENAIGQHIVPMRRLPRLPNSVLVLLTADEEHAGEVIRAATATANGRTLIFFYVTQRRPPVPAEIMQINDPYFHDTHARETFALAARITRREHVNARFVYRIGPPEVLTDAWQLLRPDEIIAEVSVAKQLSRAVAPEYVRFQVVDGVRIAHYIRHPGADGNEAALAGAVSAAAQNIGAVPRQPAQPAQPEVVDAGAEQPGPIARVYYNGHNGNRTVLQPTRLETPQAPAESADTTEGAIRPQMAEQSNFEAATNAPGNVSASIEPNQAPDAAGPPATMPDDVNQWVWTGTDLVRRDPPPEQPPVGPDDDHHDD